MKVQVSKLGTLRGHRDSVYTLEQSNVQNKVLSSGGDGMVAEWDLSDPEKGRLIAQVKSSVYAMRMFDGNKLVVAENGEGIHIIDLDDKKEAGSLKLPASQIFDIQITGNRALVASGDGTVYSISLEPLALLGNIRHSDQRARSIAINEELNEFAVGYSDHHFRIFDLQSGGLKYSCKGHSNSIFSVVYSPDRSKLLTAGRDAHLRVWDVKEGYSLESEIVAHMYAINDIKYSPDGRHFVTCSMDKSIKVWDSETFKLLKVIDKARHAGHGTSVNKLLWTNFDEILVSGSDDRTLSLWAMEFDLLA